MTKAKPSRGVEPVGGRPRQQLTRAETRRLESDLRNAERLLAADQSGLARTLLSEALRRAPRSPDVLRLLAVCSLMSRRHAEALGYAEAACAIAPHRAELAMLAGRAHKALNELAPAISSYRRAIELQPRLAEAHVSLGIALKASGDIGSAIASYRTALAIDPDLAVAHSALGNALARQVSSPSGDHGAIDQERLVSLKRAVELDPASAVAQHRLGEALAQMGQSEKAIDNFNAALALDTSREDSCVLMHATLTKLNYLEGARQCCERWLELNAPTAGVANRLVTTLLALNDFDAAKSWADTAHLIAPDMPEVLHNLATTCEQSLEVPQALEHLKRAIEIAPEYHAAREVLLMSLNYVEEDPDVILQAHRLHAPKPVPEPASEPAFRKASQDRKLRIGYVSGDLRRHSVSYFLEPQLAAHDRNRFEVTAYRSGGTSDEVTERLRAHTSAWVDAVDLTDNELARRIRDDGIDVLIDLSGHTAEGRLAVFAQRPAPVQMTYLGYPTTTGLSTIDYRISDHAIDPIGAEAWSTEALLRCERGMFCYRPEVEPEVGPLPALRNGYVTFGSFNNLAKVSDKTLSMWAGTLHAVPGSKLRLKARALRSKRVSSLLLKKMASLGITEDRLILNPWQADLQGHLGVYQEVDIALDTFPYNGATTTCESLWMGVPVITLCGRTHVSRMGLSILRSAGFEGWAATSVPRFIELSALHAARPEALAQFRSRARQQLRASALLNATAHAADFEALILAAWEEHMRHAQHTCA